VQDGLTALDLASLGGHPEVYQELVTHGKQYTLFFCLSAYTVAVVQGCFTFQSETFCCSPVSVQEADEDEPEPSQPFEWAEFCCSPIVAVPGQEEEGDDRYPGFAEDLCGPSGPVGPAMVCVV